MFIGLTSQGCGFGIPSNIQILRQNTAIKKYPVFYCLAIISRFSFYFPLTQNFLRISELNNSRREKSLISINSVAKKADPYLTTWAPSSGKENDRGSLPLRTLNESLFKKYPGYGF